VLKPHPIFKEDANGNWKQQSGWVEIEVVNRGKEPIRVQEVGMILKNGQRFPSSFMSVTISGRDNAHFRIKHDIFEQIGLTNIDSVEYVFFTDGVYTEHKSKVPKETKMEIVACLENRMIVVYESASGMPKAN
jgi:hypothetical protein